MPRDSELEAQLETLELKTEVARAVEKTRAMRRTQRWTPEAEVEPDELQTWKRRTKAIARAKSQRCPHGSQEN